MISKRLQDYLDEYAESHKNKINLTIHKICIPLIVFHFFAMFTWIPFFYLKSYSVTLSEFIALFLFFFYLYLNVFYAFIMLFFISFCIFLGHLTPVWLVWFIALSAWITQFLGHGIWEKRSPAFAKNFIQLLIGPLFVLNFFLKGMTQNGYSFRKK